MEIGDDKRSPGKKRRDLPGKESHPSPSRDSSKQFQIDDKKNHDILHIKKNSPQELHYYFSKEEQEELPAVQKRIDMENKGRGRRRFPLLIFINVILILVSFFLIRFLLFKETDEVDVAGYSFILKKIITQDNIIATVMVKRTEKVKEIEQGAAFITFSLSESNKIQKATLLLPQVLGEENIVRVNFPYSHTEKKLKALISIGKISKELSLPI